MNVIVGDCISCGNSGPVLNVVVYVYYRLLRGGEVRVST